METYFIQPRMQLKIQDVCEAVIYLVPRVICQCGAPMRKTFRNGSLSEMWAWEGWAPVAEEVSSFKCSWYIIQRSSDWPGWGICEHLCTYLQGDRLILGGPPTAGGIPPVGVWLWGLSECLFSFRCYAFQILGYFDYAFTAIFTVEILLKVMAFSLILTYSSAAVTIIVSLLCLLSRC